MDPQIFQKGVQRTPKFENLDTSLSLYGTDAKRYFIIFSMWLPQSRLSSIVTPRDLAVATWVTRKSLIASVGKTVTVLGLCVDPINMNPVFVIFRVILFALSQSFKLKKKRFFKTFSYKKLRENDS